LLEFLTGSTVFFAPRFQTTESGFGSEVQRRQKFEVARVPRRALYDSPQEKAVTAVLLRFQLVCDSSSL
jgi:hypothetical protein